MAINNMRINIIMTLKQKYPDNFIGGLQDSPLVRKCVRICEWQGHTHARNKFLKRMHNADICIATTGLHKSIGWKMGNMSQQEKTLSAKNNTMLSRGF